MLQQWFIMSDRFSIGSSPTTTDAAAKVTESKPATAPAAPTNGATDGSSAPKSQKPKRRRAKKR
jgi:hypothetical protein